MATLLTIPEMVKRHTKDGKKLFSEWFFYVHGKQGDIPGYVRIGGKVFIDIDSFERYIENEGIQRIGR